MEDADFVADSDEEEREMLEALALAEDRYQFNHQSTESTARFDCEKVEALDVKQEQGQTTVELTVKEHDEIANQTVGEQHSSLNVATDAKHDVVTSRTVEEQSLANGTTVREPTDEPVVTDREHVGKQDEDETDEGDHCVLAVKTLVEVESRTWPGINKLGGAGWIVRVHQEGESEDVFYDVRYVLGGFERHIESKWVHSSELLHKHSNREKVDRDYYHDNFINKPHERKQREAERWKRITTRNEQQTLRPRKRELPNRAELVLDRRQQYQSEAKEKRRKVSKIDEEMFVLLESTDKSLRPSSPLLNENEESAVEAQSPVVEQCRRRRNRILDSSGDEKSDDGGASSDQSEDLNRPELVSFTDADSNESLIGPRLDDVDREDTIQRREPKPKRRRYIGGYEKHGEDADALFIQPEGDPADLPDDVIRETGLKLASTKKGLMDQLRDIFAQQQKNMASFHDEQRIVSQQIKDLVEMPIDALCVLHSKIRNLRRYVTKTLVNAGEDVMNTIIGNLHAKRGSPPSALERFECDFDAWQCKLNECSSWARNIEKAVESALARRGEEIRKEDEDQAACLSFDSDESSHSYGHENATITSAELANAETAAPSNDAFERLSGDESNNNDDLEQVGSESLRVRRQKSRRPELCRTAAPQHRNEATKRLTLSDYFFRQESSADLWSNLRVVGRQTTKSPTDPRWNWLKMARKKQRFIRSGTGPRTDVSSIDLALVNKVQKKRFSNALSHDGSMCTQAQRMRIRNERFRAQPSSQHRPHESLYTFQRVGITTQSVISAGLPLAETPQGRMLQTAGSGKPTAYPSSAEQSPINWDTVFEVVSNNIIASTNGGTFTAMSRQKQAGLLAFGYDICGPPSPHHTLCDEGYELEDSDCVCGIVSHRAASLRQLVNNLRLQENRFMDCLSTDGLDVAVEDYAQAPEWLLLISLEEAYHSAIAKFAIQVLADLDTIDPSIVPNYLTITLGEIATLIRQLPDCDSLFNGCKPYFFFFEVASRNATTTPLLTAISRAYWYCLKLLVAIQSKCGRLVGPCATTKQEIEDILTRTLPVNRVILAVVLFLFDLYVYLPSSHRLTAGGIDQLTCGQLPFLSLWMLVRTCCTSSIGLDQSCQDSTVTREKRFWALLQAVYRQQYFNELARCFVRSESCGGYLRNDAPKATDDSTTEHCEEVFESQLLALDAAWNLLFVLLQCYTDGDINGHEEAVCDAKWTFVKDLLHPDKRDFLPFDLSHSQWINLLSHYRQRADVHKQRTLQRITLLSKLWRPCKDIVETVSRLLWRGYAGPCYLEDIVELPMFLKQFITHSNDLGNSRSSLAAFVGEASYDNEDQTTMLCKIIWIQILKLEKRVHRSRFQRSVLNAISDILDSHDTLQGLAQSESAKRVELNGSEQEWKWGRLEHRMPASIHPAKQPMVSPQQAPAGFEAGKEQMSVAVLLTFAIAGVCVECGDCQHFPVQRSDKDVRYMEREVDFYCKEIFRRTSNTLDRAVLASQALYILGALLLEKNCTEFPAVFRGLNDRLESSMKILRASPSLSILKRPAATRMNVAGTHGLHKSHRRLQRAAMSPLYQMRDLVKKLVEGPASGVRVGPAYGPAVEKSLEHVFNSGMELCLQSVLQKTVTVNDLKIAMEIFYLVLPRAPDTPKHCLTCEFDDFNDEAFATFDLEGAIAGYTATPGLVWTVKECKDKVIQLITCNLRGVLQQLVLNYPPSDAPAFDELYAVELLGMIISTCEAQSFWSNVMSTVLKNRNVVSRALSAAFKYNSEKEWLGRVFLRERGSDQELITAWLVGTLDVRSLNPEPIPFQVGDVPFAIRDSRMSSVTDTNPTTVSSIRYSDSWVMLSDGIIYQMLREQPVGLCNVDRHLLQILRDVASTCKFPAEVSAYGGKLHDVSKLYDLHLDVFQSFCRSAGSIWRSYVVAPAENWDELNKFRAKMVNPQFGIFVSFLEAFKMNFRRICGQIDQMNHSWHSFAELFLRQHGVGTGTSDGRSIHEMDDTMTATDERLTGLTTMFRFTYQCMDALLFYCGDMAIGDTNLFFDAMDLLFRQMNSAEYPQAIKRLEDQRLLGQRNVLRNVNDDLRKGFCPPAVRFVDSVQLFFARQKYPSLLHWFAQTSDIYQTCRGGWQRSPLRTLLMNILDPDGPLGIHSYYGVLCDLSLDVRTVRRETFYLSCGLFDCRCTRSFEHSRVKPSPTSCARLQQLRKLVLNDFMRETFVFVLQEDATTLLETMVPLCQFVRGVLNHANLNMSSSRDHQVARDGSECNESRSTHHDFQLSELQPCLEWMVACFVKLIPAVHSTIGCVLMIELCGIVCEAVAFNQYRPTLELIDLVELVLSYLHTIYVALSKSMSATVNAVFTPSVATSPLIKLSEYRFADSAFREIVVDESYCQVPDRQLDSYGIDMAQAATDLLAAIKRVAQHCHSSSDERLQSFTTL